jgi:hypothetical protein
LDEREKESERRREGKAEGEVKFIGEMRAKQARKMEGD